MTCEGICVQYTARKPAGGVKNNSKILLVDDEQDITTVFTLGLNNNGFEVDAFNDPLHALSGFKSGSYDLVLLDYRMPAMNGFELYREIRKIDKKIKVCFITAYEIYQEELKKLQAMNRSLQYEQKVDVRWFIQKPIHIDKLVERIKEELNS
jgi:two-component system, OmpR family, response regulator ChvI